MSNKRMRGRPLVDEKHHQYAVGARIIDDSQVFIRAQRFLVSVQTHAGVEPDIHDHHEFILVIRGHYRVVVGKKEVCAEPGDILFYPAGMVHRPSGTMDGSIEILVISAPPNLVTDIDFPVVQKLDSKRLLTMACWMCSLTDTGDDADGQRRLHYLYCIIDELRAAQQPPAETGLVQRALRRMRKLRVSEAVVADLARHFQVSRSTLHQAFVDQTGRSPQEHLLEMRAEEAHELIQVHGLSLVEVSKRMGHVSPRTVERWLRKVYNLSIKDLRHH